MRCLMLSVLLFAFATSGRAADEAMFLLAAQLAPGDVSDVTIKLEVGGDLVVADEAEEKKLPLSVAAELQYTEQLVAWSNSSTEPARSLREYGKATAKIQVDDAGIERKLPAERRTIVAEVRDGKVTLAGAESTLTRDDYDLVNVVGNSLALNRLLPDRELAEGDTWQHDGDAIGALLGMDNVAVCEVQSVVIGSKNGQVQVRLGGTTQGTVDGAPTEIELRAAYLFHEERQRITKFNMAIKEKRSASQIVPGLDVVAKVSVAVAPAKASAAAQGTDLTPIAEPLASVLRYESKQRDYEFLHDRAWYVTGEQRDMVSLRALQEGNLTAHCNITTLPARSEGRETTLEQFEKDVRETLGDNLDTVTASTQWTTTEGHDCLGVIALGQVKEVPIEWRYYLIASPGLPRVSVAVTVEQSSLEVFSDADRQIVDSLKLLPATKTAKSNQSGLAK